MNPANDIKKSHTSIKIVFHNYLLILVIISLLTTTNFFPNETQTSLFLYLILASIVIIATGFLLLKQKLLNVSPLTICLVLIVCFWSFYVGINTNYINHYGGKEKSYLLMTSLIFCVALIFFFNNIKEQKKHVFTAFCCVAGVQSVWCIIQFFSSSYPVKGSWINPNITAIFLAMAVPHILLNIINNKAASRKVYTFLILLVFTALILLKCRTAILGAVVALICTLEYQYKVIQNLLKKTSKIKIALAIFSLLIILIIVGVFTYNVKKDSADGRKLIWQLSMNLIAKKPLLGFGYGNFEKNYNIEQAGYFQNESNKENEITTAGYTLMAYNEFIEATIDGGIIGLIFFVSFVSLLFYIGLKYCKETNSDKQLLVATLISILVMLLMSFVNFTITAIPIMCLFIISAGFIGHSSLSFIKSIQIPLRGIRIAGNALIVIGSFFLIKNANAAYYQYKIKLATNSASDKNYENALDILKTIPIEKRFHENYHQALGNIYYAMNKKTDALVIYKEASNFYSSPELYQQLGNCYLANKEYQQAILNYEIAKNIQPNRFTPRYLQMSLYVELKDKAKAFQAAKEIVLLDEKIPSEQTAFYKKYAAKVLNFLNKK